MRKIRTRLSWTATAGLTVIWMLLWGEWTIGAALFGILIALAVQLALPLPDVPEMERFRPIRVAKIAGWALWGLMRASVTLAWQILAWRRPVRHAFLRVPLHSSSAFVRAMTAEITTLIPGSVVVDIDRHSMLLHVFDSSQSALDYARHEVRVTEDLLVHAFASKEEIAAWKEAR